MHRILAFVGGPGLGDFVIRLINAAACKLSFPAAHLTCYTRPKTNASTQSIWLCPYIDHLFTAAENALPLDLLIDAHWNAAQAVGADTQVLIATANTVLLQGMMVDQRHVLDRALLALPDNAVETAEQQLRQLGLDRGGWYACLHAREDDYRGAPGHPRSVRNLEPYVEAARHVIYKEGGQVVRLGDPAMRPFPPMDGLVDLSVFPESLVLQCAALARARYVLGSDSGPNVLARGFDVPFAAANCVNVPVHSYGATCFPREHVVATKKLRLDDGRWIADREAVDLNVAQESFWWGRDDRTLENSAEELIAMCDHLHARTALLPPWPIRALAAPVSGPIAWDRFGLTDFPITYLSEVRGEERHGAPAQPAA
jgi:putative glycosyltransferase (TIGR04372 family)